MVRIGGQEPSKVTTESRKELRARQAREVVQSQRELRESIEKTQQLLDQSEDMLNRHRRERDGDD